MKTKKHKSIKRIKENITEAEYKKLLNSIRGDDLIKETTRCNLLSAFTILYFTGLRLNEVQELRITNIVELIDTGSTKLVLSKTKSERKLFAGDEFKKQLKKLILAYGSNLDIQARVITKGSSKNKHTGINPIVFITQVNKTMKSVLGDGYTSHSFRQGLITEMGSKGINTKIISKFIGHSDVKTTMRYINPTDEDLKGAMIR
jgi:integrase/recombinase XerD